jgi:transposase
MRLARRVELNSESRKAVERLARGRSQPAGLVERARIVLRAADGLPDKEIAQQLGITPEKAARWRNRFLEGGIVQKDASRPGRTRTITEDQVKRVVGITILRRIWHAHGLKPHLVRTFKLSRDIRFAEKLETIVGLYLNPPKHALLLCADGKYVKFPRSSLELSTT